MPLEDNPRHHCGHDPAAILLTFSMILQSQPQPNCFSPASCSSQKEYLTVLLPICPYMCPPLPPIPTLAKPLPSPVEQWPPAFSPGASFMKDIFSMDGGGGSKCITFIVHFILLLLHQLYLESSGIRSQRLGAPALETSFCLPGPDTSFSPHADRFLLVLI